MTTPSFQPPSAAVRSLDASTTGVPNQSPSSNEASPALIPTRIANRARLELRTAGAADRLAQHVEVLATHMVSRRVTYVL